MNTKQAMLAPADALATLLSAVRPITETECLDTLLANGRVLAEAVFSGIDVPSMDNAQMDGYAVRVADCAVESVRLRVSQRIPAGHVGEPLEAGTAARIFTGAMLPPGADAVVMQEKCAPQASEEGDYVCIEHRPATGEWIRRRGEDIAAESCVLSAGTVLGAVELGLAASVGAAKLTVCRRPRVAIFFTGDELVMPGERLPPGAIYNSNRFVLRGLLENLGCQIDDFGIVPDNLEATRQTLRAAAQGHDLIITSGGVSVGEEDHVRPAVQAEGRLDLWQIAIKPGKPLAFGEVGQAFFFGLPGNPISSLVTFLLFVRPFLRKMQGAAETAPKRYTMRADFDWLKPGRRNEFLRVRLNECGGLELFPNQGSAVLTSAAWGDGLVDVAPGQSIRSGDTVSYLPFSDLFFG